MLSPASADVLHKESCQNSSRMVAAWRLLKKNSVANSALLNNRRRCTNDEISYGDQAQLREGRHTTGERIGKDVVHEDKVKKNGWKGENMEISFCKRDILDNIR